ncbi:MAG: AraC family transcriptional regulator [Saprospiraceae bacterium]|nr:helix-turn-helix transcriptional regulator [Saprospiraceae bacterium]
MLSRKNTQNGNSINCFEDAELFLEIIKPEHILQRGTYIFGKSKVHILFCLQTGVLFRFGPVYSRLLAAGKAFIIYNPEADLSTILESSDPGHIIHISLSLQKLHQLFVPGHQSASVFKLFDSQLKTYEEIEIESELLLVLNQLTQKSNNPDLNRLFYNAKILEIISLLYLEKPQQVEHCPFLKNEATVRKIKNAKDILISEYKNPPTIPELSKAVQLNEFQLKSGFKEIYGIAPYHFLMAHKLEIAKQLLLSGDYQVQEAAYEIGYSNTSHFIEAFKKQFGMTPKKLTSNKFI